MADAAPGPFETLADRETWTRIEAAVAALSPEQQHVFWMRVVGELPYAAVWVARKT